MRARAEEVAALAGIARWKRARVKAFFPNAVFRDTPGEGPIACWASRVPAALEGVPMWWIEDGFLRSAGLGAALVQPGSLTLDSVCPHYDPSQASDLETMLETADLAPELLARAEALIALLRETAVTKYHLAGEPVELPAGRRVVLVAGQVEDDRSVLLGGAGIATMAELLRRVRAEEGDAYILYKPHPDVVSKLRAGSLSEAEALASADQVVADASLPALLDRVDAVHVLTSLAGFEALVRGRRVVVHGQPFYAGWGLTEDRAPVARRTRRRSLAELVAAALIEYPLYVDLSGRRCTPEQLVAEIASQGPARSISGIRGFAARVAAWHAARRNARRRDRQGEF